MTKNLTPKQLAQLVADKSDDMSILLAHLEISDSRLERRIKYKDELIEKQREIILRLTEEKGQQEKEIAQNMFSYNDIHEQLGEAELLSNVITDI
jgi:DNA-binding protein H-NS